MSLISANISPWFLCRYQLWTCNLWCQNLRLVIVNETNYFCHRQNHIFQLSFWSMHTLWKPKNICAKFLCSRKIKSMPKFMQRAFYAGTTNFQLMLLNWLNMWKIYRCCFYGEFNVENVHEGAGDSLCKLKAYRAKLPAHPSNYANTNTSLNTSLQDNKPNALLPLNFQPIYVSIEA